MLVAGVVLVCSTMSEGWQLGYDECLRNQASLGKIEMRVTARNNAIIPNT